MGELDPPRTQNHDKDYFRIITSVIIGLEIVSILFMCASLYYVYTADDIPISDSVWRMWLALYFLAYPILGIAGLALGITGLVQKRNFRSIYIVSIISAVLLCNCYALILLGSAGS